MTDNPHKGSPFEDFLQKENLTMEVNQDLQRILESHQRGFDNGYRTGFNMGYKEALLMCFQIGNNKTKSDYLQSLADKIDSLTE